MGHGGRRVRFAVALLAVLVPCTTARADGIDPRGDWQAVYSCVTGWCAGQQFAANVSITFWDPASGAFSGSYADEALTGQISGSTVTLTARIDDYTATMTLTMSSDGSTMSGSGSDSNGTSGTTAITRLSPPPDVSSTAPETTVDAAPTTGAATDVEVTAAAPTSVDVTVPVSEVGPLSSEVLIEPAPEGGDGTTRDDGWSGGEIAAVVVGAAAAAAAAATMVARSRSGTAKPPVDDDPGGMRAMEALLRPGERPPVSIETLRDQLARGGVNPYGPTGNVEPPSPPTPAAPPVDDDPGGMRAMEALLRQGERPPVSIETMRDQLARGGVNPYGPTGNVEPPSPSPSPPPTPPTDPSQ